MSTLEQDRATVTEDARPAETEAIRPLSGIDRCDSCGAQAYVRATVHGTELLFCAHHARKHEAKLRPVADSWHDEIHKLSAE